MMTLDERAAFERLLTEHANACMDYVRAGERRHAAMHACIDYINVRTDGVEREFYNAGVSFGKEHAERTEAYDRRHVPAGTTATAPPVHLSVDPGVPFERCLCTVCNDARAAARVAKPPIADTSGGN